MVSAGIPICNKAVEEKRAEKRTFPPRWLAGRRRFKVEERLDSLLNERQIRIYDFVVQPLVRAQPVKLFVGQRQL